MKKKERTETFARIRERLVDAKERVLFVKHHEGEAAAFRVANEELRTIGKKFDATAREQSDIAYRNWGLGSEQSKTVDRERATTYQYVKMLTKLRDSLAASLGVNRRGQSIKKRSRQEKDEAKRLRAAPSGTQGVLALGRFVK